MSNNVSFTFKLLLLGDSAVGKTCFFTRFTDNIYMESHLSTIGTEISDKIVEVDDKKKKNKKIKIRVQLTDTAGQDRFRFVAGNYFKSTNGILLLYDVTSQTTFDHITNWIKQITDNASADVRIILVANKIDVTSEERVVSKEAGEELAKKLNLKYMEGSAKENINIAEIFNTLIDDVYDKEKDNDQSNANQKIRSTKKKKDGCC